MSTRGVAIRECEVCDFWTEDYQKFWEHTQTHLTGRGICIFHSETGTEGGWWAFQDDGYRNIPDDKQFRCSKCGARWDKRRDPDSIPAWLLEPRAYDENVPVTSENPFAHSYCMPDEHEWALAFPDGKWSYYGLHVLGDGDRLTIYDKDDPAAIVWEGVIDMVRLPQFTEHIHGMWVNVEQIGIDRETWGRWFFEEYPATLTKRAT